jgi:hypothetical protein
MIEFIIGCCTFGIVIVVFIALCCKDEEPVLEPPPKKTEAFMDNLEEISENVAFHVIANSNKRGGTNAVMNAGVSSQNQPTTAVPGSSLP